MTTVKWVKTSAELFSAIFKHHDHQLFVADTITDTSDYHGAPEIMTEWSLSEADYPFMKAHLRDGEQTFWLAAVKGGDDD